MKIGEKQRTMLARYSVLSATGLRVCMRDVRLPNVAPFYPGGH